MGIAASGSGPGSVMWYLVTLFNDKGKAPCRNNT
jgi:hypothetical protein